MTALTLVTGASEAAAETLAERIQRLQGEVRALSTAQVEAMRNHVREGLEIAREVAMNPAQPEGVRQVAEKLVRDGESLLLTLGGVIARAS